MLGHGSYTMHPFQLIAPISPWFLVLCTQLGKSCTASTRRFSLAPLCFLSKKTGIHTWLGDLSGSSRPPALLWCPWPRLHLPLTRGSHRGLSPSSCHSFFLAYTGWSPSSWGQMSCCRPPMKLNWMLDRWLDWCNKKQIVLDLAVHGWQIQHQGDWGKRIESSGFKTNLRYRTRPCLKKEGRERKLIFSDRVCLCTL